MNWITDNWYWILGGLLLVGFLWSKRSQAPKLTQAQAAALVDALIDTFDSILTTLLPERYSASDRRKIAVGMVAVMAARKISLDSMKNNPSLVVAVAAQSAAILAQEGHIRPL